MMVEENEKSFSFEENLAELEKIVTKLETGEVPLDDAIEEFKKAMDLVKQCDEKLNSAQEAIAKIEETHPGPYVQELVDFCKESKRGISAAVKIRHHATEK